MPIFFPAILIFIVSGFLICYTYVIFPWILKILVKTKKNDPNLSQVNSNMAGISILIAAYNEESVIEKKIISIVESKYPENLLQVVIGSDASSDKTCEIVREQQKKFQNLELVEFNARRGKPAVVNELVAHAKFELLILTDANVFFDPEMIKRLSVRLNDERVGLVGANILNIGLKKDGISIQEKSYIQRENLIKYREGVLWGCMMGPFGGCFALRKKLFEKIPEGFLVDDFYLAMKIIGKKYLCINDLEAICYEDVSNDIAQEYKRKSRISAGNFQNLKYFSSILFRPFTPAGFCFFSHKFLRWITPFLIIASLLSLFILSIFDKRFIYVLLAEIALLCSPFIDWFFKKLGLHIRILRFISYFSYMNLALLKGFFKYMKGINSGIWAPTKRN